MKPAHRSFDSFDTVLCFTLTLPRALDTALIKDMAHRPPSRGLTGHPEQPVLRIFIQIQNLCFQLTMAVDYKAARSRMTSLDSLEN